MGRPDGFLRAPRVTAPKRGREARVRDWAEFVEPREAEQVETQAGRCMDCGIPFCQQGCPLGNRIPDFNDLVYRDRWERAWATLSSTNNFPEFTGRVCPAPCEAACVLAINTGAVTIEQIEKEIAEKAFDSGWVQPTVPRTRSGKRVAVVGSGPAGLAAAAQLNAAGHRVVVFERDERPGGLLRFGIPDFKLEKRVVERRIDVMVASGIEFRTGVAVGSAVSFADLQRQFDAVVLAIGATVPRDLHVEGRDLGGVHFAMEFLGQQNRLNAGLPTAGARIDASGRRVVILGGGDTGSDCLGTSIRQGAAHITQMELMPAPPTQRTDRNPWPQWPMVFTASSSHDEGGERVFAWETTRLLGSDGRVTGIEGRSVEVTLDRGVPRFVPVAGSERVIEADLVLLAMGFVSPAAETAAEQLGVALNGRGAVAHDGQFRTSVPGVYVAGDAGRGASLVVWAISEGREAARVVDADLMSSLPRLPSRGQDRPFGGR